MVYSTDDYGATGQPRAGIIEHDSHNRDAKRDAIEKMWEYCAPYGYRVTAVYERDEAYESWERSETGSNESSLTNIIGLIRDIQGPTRYKRLDFQCLTTLAFPDWGPQISWAPDGRTLLAVSRCVGNGSSTSAVVTPDENSNDLGPCVVVLTMGEVLQSANPRCEQTGPIKIDHSLAYGILFLVPPGFASLDRSLDEIQQNATDIDFLWPAVKVSMGRRLSPERLRRHALAEGSAIPLPGRAMCGGEDLLITLGAPSE